MENKTYEMNEGLDIAKIGEERIVQWYKDTYGDRLTAVIDVRDVVEYQNKDIDFIFEIDGKPVTVDVKTDRYKTGNYYFETVSNTTTGSLGCFYGSEADFWAYYFVELGKFALIPMKKAQEWFKKHEKYYTNNGNQPATRDANGKILYYSFGYKVFAGDFNRCMGIEFISMP